MIRQLFKLTWNQRRSNYLIMIEIFFSFLVLFFVSCNVMYHRRLYLQSTGFDYRNLWKLEVRMNGISDEAQNVHLLSIQNKLKSFKEVEAMTFTTNAAPYHWNNKRYLATNGEQSSQALSWTVDDNFAQVMRTSLLKGRWFDPRDNAAKDAPIVLTQALEEELFGEESALGKVVQIDKTDRLVIGVTENFKQYEEDDIQPGFFERKTLQDAPAMALPNIVLRVKAGVGLDIEEQLHKAVADVLNNGKEDWWGIHSASVEQERSSNLMQKIAMIAILTIISGFLIINVVVGLFGVFWQNIHRRRSELGLRRAIGATATQINLQILGEAMVLTTFALIPGLIVAMQFPILQFLNVQLSVYLQGTAIALLLTYLLVAACALYPGKLASNIMPAEALLEN